MREARRRIMLDLDGVCYRWDDTARYLLKAHRGLEVDESQDWNWIQQRIGEEDWQWLWSEGVKLGLFRHGSLYKGTVDAVRQLAELGTLVACTSRPESAVEDTLAWLAYQRFPFTEVHVLSRLQKKSDIPHCDIYLDDGPHNIEDLRTNTFGATVCVMDRPWNQDVQEGPTVLRVRSWTDFVVCAKYLPNPEVAL